MTEIKKPANVYFHMSATIHAVGTTLTGNGKDKVDPAIEDALERYRPDHLLDRRSAVYTLTRSDFSRCGITQPGYIYEVSSTVEPQIHDLGWIGPMQMALIKQKYPTLAHLKKYADWSDGLVQSCCENYWSAANTNNPTWEALFEQCIVKKQLSDEAVDPSKTKYGFRNFP